ncbi:unnamed protein product [Citrullus colocynthis]|uniref:Uncharacterized protein n=1 Tax=Citrullus colocynthis TaxID=252529 RepID=A0ABP0XYR5_9ROSI
MVQEDLVLSLTVQKLKLKIEEQFQIESEGPSFFCLFLPRNRISLNPFQNNPFHSSCSSFDFPLSQNQRIFNFDLIFPNSIISTPWNCGKGCSRPKFDFSDHSFLDFSSVFGSPFHWRMFCS